ncbi:hypothetical protein [Asanoa siamensis]|uniref:Uncharacterized protein n=1 Tax=Asanoa siamensis TaxID=926357 RepID=A0ABQ4D493_9ACTN|nr:hypothetical protein [Asanoa siamensis]GIF78365.1 hypothetical protein Asi02nite_78830 [Asanoa siamensis]
MKSLVESAEMVGLAEKVGADKFRFLPDRSAASLDPHERIDTPHIPHQPADRGHARPTPPEQPQKMPVLRQSLPIAGGEILLQVTMEGALPPAAFIQVGKVMEELQKLVEILPSSAEVVDGDLPD